jgi:hypothetical protein
VLALSIGPVPTADASPTICVTADPAVADAARARFAGALARTDRRSFEMAIDSNIETSRHIAAVTVHARVVVSDHRGVLSMVAASATASGKARAAVLTMLRDQAAAEAIDAIAARVRSH